MAAADCYMNESTGNGARLQLYQEPRATSAIICADIMQAIGEHLFAGTIVFAPSGEVGRKDIRGSPGRSAPALPAAGLVLRPCEDLRSGKQRHESYGNTNSTYKA